MARDGAIKIVGLNETIKALKAIGTPTRAISKAGKKGAAIVASEARSIAPSRTGNLRSTIKTQVGQFGSSILAGGPSALYGNAIHWGWLRDRKTARAIASPKGYILRGIKPNPFLAKALGYKRQEILDIYRIELNKLIAEETAKANGAK
jgi:HK97 gp10 family phage protein